MKTPGQPFTFAGVASYVAARVSRLLAVAALFALLPGVVSGWFAARCWWPVLTEAVERLPQVATIQQATLHIDEKDARLLAANQFLSIQFALGDAPPGIAPVDVALVFGRYELMVTSLLGDALIPYPDGWVIPLDRNSTWPLWGAWKVPLLIAFAFGAMACVMLSWLALGLLYAPVARAVGAIARRQLTFGSAWKLSVAAQWPASLLMTFAIGLYSSGEIGLLFVIIMFAAHFIPSVLNILIAPFFVPKAAPREKRNPFETEKRSKRASRNPFRGASDDD